MFPTLDTNRIKAENDIEQAKNLINRLKNVLADESDLVSGLKTYRDSLEKGDWKDKVSAAITSIGNIHKAITDEGL